MVIRDFRDYQEHAFSNEEIRRPMIISKKTIPRRAFLRGAGASLALPLLDSMIPALANAQSRLKPPARLGVVYVPNGVIMDRWTPKTEAFWIC